MDRNEPETRQTADTRVDCAPSDHALSGGETNSQGLPAKSKFYGGGALGELDSLLSRQDKKIESQLT